MPPPGHGVHHYYFRLFALDTELPVEPGLEKKAILDAIRGHVLADGVLMGTYETEEVTGAELRAGPAMGECGQIANLPPFWQVGNLPHVAIFLERAIIPNPRSLAHARPTPPPRSAS